MRKEKTICSKQNGIKIVPAHPVQPNENSQTWTHTAAFAVAVLPTGAHVIASSVLLTRVHRLPAHCRARRRADCRARRPTHCRARCATLATSLITMSSLHDQDTALDTSLDDPASCMTKTTLMLLVLAKHTPVPAEHDQVASIVRVL